MIWRSEDATSAPPEFPPAWASAWGDDVYGLWADLDVRGVVQRLRWIEPGRFIMGTSAQKPGVGLAEWPPHEVLVTKGYWLSDTLCSQALWHAVVGGKNPSHFKGDLLPVELVSWDDTQHFLRELDRLSPGVAPSHLPTEAQWEYACRAGSETAYWWGDEPDIARANLPRSVSETTPCKLFPCNPWGLYDMHGNLFEWCADAPRAYSPKAVADPHGGVKGTARIVRGGSWLDSAGFGRSAFRFDDLRDRQSLDVGFRFVFNAMHSPGGARTHAVLADRTASASRIDSTKAEALHSKDLGPAPVELAVYRNDVLTSSQPDKKLNSVRRKMDRAMRAALRAGHFTVQYQPQVSLMSAELMGVEALLRWNDPVNGFVTPAQYIPVAEDTGFIAELGQFALNAALEQSTKWLKRGMRVPVAVNVSTLEFEQTSFAGHIAKVLDSHGLPGTMLELEITEGSLLGEINRMAETLSALAKQGVRVAIDDFGTGYSSLSQLTLLPISRLKIDRGIVRGLPDDSSDAAIVRAIMELAKAHQLPVVAVGVETQAQRDFLERAGCQYGQGYFFAPPLTPLEFEASHFPRNTKR